MPPGGGQELLHWLRAQGLLGAGSRLCPACARDHGAFLLPWRFAWSFACPEHCLVLEPACPGCGRSHSYDPNPRPTLSSLVPVAYACANQRPRGQAGVRRGNCRPCGYPLGHDPPRPATARTAEAQRRLLAVFRGEQAVVHGEAVTAAEWRAELGGVLRVLAQLGHRGELGDIAPAAEAAFEAFVRSTAPAARGRPSGWSPDPALLAAIMPAATELLAQPTQSAFDAALEPLVRRGFDTRVRFLTDAQRLGATGRTMQAWGRVLGRTVHLTTRLRSRNCGPAAVPRGLDRLPQLLWPAVFDDRFSRFLPGVRRGLRRRFCALALGVLATKGSYLKVAAGLGLPVNDSLAHHLSQRLRTEGQDGDFYDALVATSDWLGHQTLTVDYGARRRAFADLELISEEDWAWVGWATGSRVDRGRRRRHASTWLWCVLTGGAMPLAPTVKGESIGSEKVTYRRFVADHESILEPALLVLAARELQRRGLSGPVRADLAAWEPQPPPVPEDLAALGVFAGRTQRETRRSRPALERTRVVPFLDDLVHVFGLDLIALMIGTRRRMIYRYQDGERRPGRAIQLRLAHLTDLVAVLRRGRNEHAVLRWFTGTRADGRQVLSLLTAQWHPNDDGPSEALTLALAETPGPPPPPCALNRRGRKHTLTMIHDAFDRFGRDDLVSLVGVSDVVLQRYRRGDNWPSWDAQCRLRELLDDQAAVPT